MRVDTISYPSLQRVHVCSSPRGTIGCEHTDALSDCLPPGLHCSAARGLLRSASAVHGSGRRAVVVHAPSPSPPPGLTRARVFGVFPLVIAAGLARSIIARRAMPLRHASEMPPARAAAPTAPAERTLAAAAPGPSLAPSDDALLPLLSLASLSVGRIEAVRTEGTLRNSKTRTSGGPSTGGWLASA